MPGTIELPTPDVETDPKKVREQDYTVIVWDDPVNLQTYVVYVFMELFGYSKARATELMLQVHNDGKAIVSTGSREEMEHDVARLHEYGLWATLQRGDQL